MPDSDDLETRARGARSSSASVDPFLVRGIFLLHLLLRDALSAPYLSWKDVIRRHARCVMTSLWQQRTIWFPDGLPETARSSLGLAIWSPVQLKLHASMGRACSDHAMAYSCNKCGRGFRKASSARQTCAAKQEEAFGLERGHMDQLSLMHRKLATAICPYSHIEAPNKW